jgi:hypothetical protein
LFHHDKALSQSNIISHSAPLNSEFRQLYSNATATCGCTKSESRGIKQRFGILLLKIMKSILAKFFRACGVYFFRDYKRKRK